MSRKRHDPAYELGSTVGVAGLTAADYTGGIFQAGAVLNLPESKPEKPIPVSATPHSTSPGIGVQVLHSPKGVGIRITEFGGHEVEVLDLKGRKVWGRSHSLPTEY